MLCLMITVIIAHATINVPSLELVYTFWKLTVDTLEQVVKSVQSQQKRHNNNVNEVTLVPLL